MLKQGSYLLYLDIKHDIAVEIGALGKSQFPAGRYVYVGSANRGIEQRVARHRRLAESKTGKIHWHVDFLLTHPKVRLVRIMMQEGQKECELSHEIAAKRGTTIPVPTFGATDCRAGCKTHLYRITGAGW